MQEASHCGKKIQSGTTLRAKRLRQQTLGVGPDARLLQLRNEAEPTCDLVVPQAAGRVLNVRFQVKNGVAVLVVARRCQIDQPLLQLQGLTADHFRNHLRAQLFKQPRVAADVAAIQQGDVEFKIVAVQLATLRQGAGGGANAKVKVPKGLGNLRNDPLLRT